RANFHTFVRRSRACTAFDTARLSLSRSNSRPGSLVIEVHQPVALVESQREQTEHRKTKQARHLGPEIAALFPHVKGSDPGATLPETGKLQEQTARLTYVRNLAVDPADPHA